MARENRKAFTLVELLVVIVIIGMLMALLLPAIAGARARARRTQCTNRQQELGKALIQYELAKGWLPGYVNRLAMNVNGVDDDGDAVIDDDDEITVSWVVMVLEYLGEGDLWKKWRKVPPVLSDKVNPASADFAAVTLPGVICPSDDTAEGIAPLSYVVNCGLSDFGLHLDPPAANTHDVGPNPPSPWGLEQLFAAAPDPATMAANAVRDSAYGLFFNHSWSNPTLRTRVMLDKITDGAQNTIMLSENIQASQWAPTTAATPPLPRTPMQPDVGMLWWSEQAPFVSVAPGDGRLINDERKQELLLADYTDVDPSLARYFARPSSHHSGGVVVTFADGHSAFQSEDIDYDVYQSLMTPKVSKAKTQGLAP